MLPAGCDGLPDDFFITLCCVIVSEFKDVVFEDVVLDNNRFGLIL